MKQLCWNIGRLVALLIFSWCTMVMTHEIGHLIGGAFSGARLVEFDLRPWSLPYSLHGPDPHPLVTLWMGPLLGVAFPLGSAVLLANRTCWFAADFCLLANGMYLALGAFSPSPWLDTTRLLDSGASPWTIGAFVMVTVPVGYWRFRRDLQGLFSPTQKAAENQASDLDI